MSLQIIIGYFLFCHHFYRYNYNETPIQQLLLYATTAREFHPCEHQNRESIPVFMGITM